MNRFLPAIAVALIASAAHAAEPAAIDFTPEKDRLLIRVGGESFATYVHADPKISRPHFAHVRVPGGPQVTRNHPPKPGQDPVDHDTFHPGLWLAFGDLNKSDSWRNKAKIVHAKFVDPPTAKDGIGRWTALNEHFAADGKTILARETARFSVRAVPAGVLLVWDANLRAEGTDLVFGDQEEMGLGLRIATGISGKAAGRLALATGERGEKNVRGKTAPWCDYSGVLDGRHVGIALMPDPANVRPSWYHARDYGLLVANPFGRKALTKGESGEYRLPANETLRLRFAILVHAAPADRPADLAAAFESAAAILKSE